MVAQDRCNHRNFFLNWLEGLKQAAVAKKTMISKHKRTELGSNEAGAQWSLDDDKEAALNNEMNSEDGGHQQACCPRESRQECQ